MGDQRRSGGRSGRRWLAAAIMVAAGSVTAGCTGVGGTAVIAPYRSPPLSSATAAPLRSDVGGVLAVSPDGDLVAVPDQGKGICLRPLDSRVNGSHAPVCATLPLSGRHTISAAFSPDGLRLAVGRDVTAQGGGSVWLVDVATGRSQAVPSLQGATPGAVPTAAAPTAAAPTGTGAPMSIAEAGDTSAYLAMAWDHDETGPDEGQAGPDHLLLISNSIEKAGARTRLVDVDPTSLVPRVVAEATGPYEFQSGFAAAGGPKMIFTVFRGDQLPPNLVVIDLESGERHEFGPLGPSGTQLVPLGVSPDGRRAIVGSATYQNPGAPRLLDLATGTLTAIPGLTGDFLLGAFSPDGSQVVVLSAVGTTSSRIAVASVAGGRARTLAEIPTRPSSAGRVIWSGRNIIGIEAPLTPGTPASPAGSVVGWRVSG